MILPVHVEDHTLQSPIPKVGALAKPDQLLALINEGVVLTDLTGWRVWRLLGDTSLKPHLNLPSDRPLTIGGMYSDENRTLARLAQDEHLLLSHSAHRQPFINVGLNEPSSITSNEISHGIALVVVAGAGAKAILRKLCGLDFRDKGFSNLSAAQGSLARLPCTLMRRDWLCQPAYMLMVGRSVGRYLWELLLDTRIATNLTTLEATSYPADFAVDS